MIRQERPGDIAAREALLNIAFGDTRHRKSSERLREDRLPADGLAFVATEGKRVIGTARLWHIACGTEKPALLLGPVAVAEDCRDRGVGGVLVRRAIAAARKLGTAAILLVGDAPYYGRFGFSAEKTGALRMPGPYEQNRLLAIELEPGALDGAHGLIRAAGRRATQPKPVAPAVGMPATASHRLHAPRAA